MVQVAAPFCFSCVCVCCVLRIAVTVGWTGGGRYPVNAHAHPYAHRCPSGRKCCARPLSARCRNGGRHSVAIAAVGCCVRVVGGCGICAVRFCRWAVAVALGGRSQFVGGVGLRARCALLHAGAVQKVGGYRDRFAAGRLFFLRVEDGRIGQRVLVRTFSR